MDQFYYEEGYIVEGYYSIVREAEATLTCSASINASGDIADTTGYIIDGYVEEGYYKTGGEVREFNIALAVVASATPTVGKLQDAECDFGSLFSPSVVAYAVKSGDILLQPSTDLSATVSPIRDNDAALTNIVNLSLQGDRSREATSNLSTESSISVGATRTRDNNATLSTQFTQTILIVTEFDANISSNSTVTAQAISFVPRTLPFGRPTDLTAYKFYGASNTHSEESTAENYSTAYIGSNPSYPVFQFEETIDDSLYIPYLESSFDTINIGASDDFYISFFYNPNDNSSVNAHGTIFRLGDSEYSVVVEEGITPRYFTGGTNDAVEITYNDSTNTLNAYVKGPQGSVTLSGTVYAGYVILYRTNGTVYLKNNSVAKDNASFAKALYGFDNTGLYPHYGPTTTTFDREPQFSDAILKIGTDQNGTNYTVGNQFSDEYTAFYYPLTDTLEDSVAQTIAADVDLNTQFTINSNVGLIVGATADLSTAISTDIIANTVFDHTAQLDVTASTTATTGFLIDNTVNTDSIATNINVVNKIGNTLVSIDTVSTVEAIVNPIIGFTVDVDAQASLAIQDNYVFDNTATANSAFALTVDASGGFIGIEAQTKSAEFDITVDADRIRTVDSEIQYAEITAITSAHKLTDTNASVDSVVTVTADAQRFRDVDTDFDAIATEISVVNRIGRGFITLDAPVTLTIEARKIAENEIVFDCIANFDATVGKITDVDSSVAIQTQLTANGITGKDVVADLSTTAEFNVDANLVIDVDTDFDAIATVADLSVERVRSVNTNIETEFSIETDTTIIRSTTADLNTSATVDANGGKTIDIIVDLGALFTPTLDYRIRHLDQYVYTIPREIRMHSLHREDRSFTVNTETRNYTIGN